MDTLSPSSPVVSKTFSPSTINAGGTALLTITIRNTHALVSATLTTLFTDLYPTGLVNASPSSFVTTTGCSAGVASATPNLGTLTLPIGTLIPQASTCTITVVVTSSVGGTVTNTIAPASLTTSVGTNSITVSAVIGVIPTVNLSVTKLSNTTTVATGATTTFSFVISNAGPSTLTNASFVDTLPSQFGNAQSLGSAVSGSAVTGTFTISGTTIQGSVTIPSGGRVTVTVQVTAISTGSYTNTLTVLVPAGTTNLGSSTATASGTVTNVVNLGVSKLVGSSTVAVGGTTSFTLVVTNAGPSTLTSSINDTLPSQFTSTIARVSSSVNGSASTANFTLVAGVFAGSVTIASGGTVTVTIEVTAVTVGSYTNTLTVLIPAGTTNNGSTTATVPGTVTSAPANMSTSFAGFPASAPVNTVVNGTANFVNVNTAANATATSATFTLQLPTGLVTANVTVTSALLGTGVYNSTTGVVTFNTATLAIDAPGATVSASISFLQTSTGVAGTGTTGAVNDTVAANNTNTFSVLASAADMSVSFAGFPSSATAGTTVTGTVSFANISTTPSSTATSVTVTLKLKPGLPTGNVTVTSAILGVGVYDSVTGVVTFPTSPPNVTPGQTITASISFVQTSTNVVGTATAASVNDTNSSNNTTTFIIAAGNNATLSGRVFQDVRRNKVFDAGIDLPIANFRAEVIRVTGSTTTVIGSGLTDEGLAELKISKHPNSLSA
jgi:uncharacterized repeat protein (TIGR01451 family)